MEDRTHGKGSLILCLGSIARREMYGGGRLNILFDLWESLKQNKERLQRKVQLSLRDNKESRKTLEGGE